MRPLNNILSGLGLVPNGKRTVTPIPAQLLALVPKPQGKNEVVKSSDADPERDTVPMLMRNVRRQKWQGAKLAQALKGSSRYETVKNIYDFIFSHIQYELDPSGSETVRSLRRLIADKKGDCDCFASGIANLLLNLNIPFAFRVAAYNGSSDYSHIYIVVPKSGSSLANGYYTIDPVVHKFNNEVPFSTKKDFGMNLKSLDGLADDFAIANNGRNSFSCKINPKYNSSSVTDLSQQQNPNATSGSIITVRGAQIEQMGLTKSSDLLKSAGIPFTQVTKPDGRFALSVATPNGEKLVDAFVPIAQKSNVVADVKAALAAPATPAKKETSHTDLLKILLGVTGLAIVASGLRSASNAKALGALPRKKIALMQV